MRALRPLRALKIVPGMRALVSTILGVIPKMATVAMLCAFMFVVFGIVGIQIYEGVLHNRCAASGYEATIDAASGRSSLSPDEQAAYDSGMPCDPLTPASCESFGDGAFPSCSYFDNSPGGGLLSFDSFGPACVVLLMTITFDDWANPM